jgi:hypothetical protein
MLPDFKWAPPGRDFVERNGEMYEVREVLIALFMELGFSSYSLVPPAILEQLPNYGMKTQIERGVIFKSAWGEVGVVLWDGDLWALFYCDSDLMKVYYLEPLEEPSDFSMVGDLAISVIRHGWTIENGAYVHF